MASDRLTFSFFPVLDPVSDALFARARRLIPGGVNSPVRAFRAVGGSPFFVKSAHGATLVTADDRELIDFVGTWGPAILGHAPISVIEAISTAISDPGPYRVGG